MSRPSRPSLDFAAEPEPEPEASEGETAKGTR